MLGVRYPIMPRSVTDVPGAYIIAQITRMFGF